jgi:hypothetical protein
MNRPASRTAACTRADALRRQDQAEKFLQVAELVEADSDQDAASANVSASLAVLAGSLPATPPAPATTPALSDHLDQRRNPDHPARHHPRTTSDHRRLAAPANSRTKWSDSLIRRGSDQAASR